MSEKHYLTIWNLRPMLSPSRALALLGALMLSSTLLLYALLSEFSATVSPNEPLEFPGSIAELKKLQNVLVKGVHDHFLLSMAAFSAVYAFKQTFAIPGSFLMNLAAGALFGTVNGVLLASFLTAAGASTCFALSKFVGASLKSIPAVGKRVAVFEERVSSARSSGSLFFFLVSARFFPFTPNWLLNMASPWVGVPWGMFVLSVIVGLFPYHFMSVRAGTVLQQIESTSDAMDGWAAAQLIGIALLSLLPPYLLKEKGVQSPQSKVM